MAPRDNNRGLGPSAQRWWAPDLALAISALTLFYCLFLFGGATRLFRDSDTGWHIRTGENILNGLGIPIADRYSFSKSGQRWMAWEWGADVMMGALHRAYGLPSVAWFYALCISACVWLWVRLTWRAGGDFLIACLMLPMLWTTSGLHWLARPHILGWLWLLALLLAVERTSSVFTRRHAVCFCLGAAAWANTHASFGLGFLVLALYVAGEGLAWLLWSGGDLSRARWCALALACALPGTMLNPYGWELHQHVLSYLRDTSLLSRVAEFQSFNFHADGASIVALTLLVTFAGAACALSQRNAGRCLVLLFLGLLALRSARGLPLAAIAALPLANGSLTLALLRLRGLRPIIHRGLDAFLTYSGNLRKLDAGLGGLACAPLLALAAWFVLTVPAVSATAGFSPAEFPAVLMQRVDQLPASARILAPDKFGGYLIYRFAGRRQVYFDGRSDFYGAAFMTQYIELIEARPGWQQTVRAFAFTHALLPKRASLRAALECAGWHFLAEDQAAVLLERPRDW